MQLNNDNLVFNCLKSILKPVSKISRKKRSQIVLGLLSIAFSLVLSGMLKASAQTSSAQSDNPYGMVDPVAESHAAGYEIYVERCATCHVAIPPALLPLEAWPTIITDRAHYGVTLPDIPPFDQQLMVNYLQTYSRSYRGRGATTFRLSDSDFFTALHPNVTLPEPLNLRSCTSCHLGAAEQDYSGAAEQDYSGAAEQS